MAGRLRWTVRDKIKDHPNGTMVTPVRSPPIRGANPGRFRVRTAVYFRRDQHLEPFIVQTAWLVGTLAALLISARRLGRAPAQ